MKKLTRRGFFTVSAGLVAAAGCTKALGPLPATPRAADAVAAMTGTELASYANAVSEILAPMQTAIDALGHLATYRPPDPLWLSWENVKVLVDYNPDLVRAVYSCVDSRQVGAA